MKNSSFTITGYAEDYVRLFKKVDGSPIFPYYFQMVVEQMGEKWVDDAYVCNCVELFANYIRDRATPNLRAKFTDDDFIELFYERNNWIDAINEYIGSDDIYKPIIIAAFWKEHQYIFEPGDFLLQE